jgi:acetyl/propionyl-CoA carboxylase alpha subunit
MRLIREESEIAGAIPAARREAIAAFGDGTLYVERLIEQAHHVEVQVFGDASGEQIVHLFERECSVQRRHQKVIEESPSPSIGADLRDRITRAGVMAAQAVSYRNAGTVEFLVDIRTGSFYFLEMNTRLQVEHPVTEQVVGVDLVRAQLVVASRSSGSATEAGGLPWTQDALRQRGHAIEARVYAEDPDRGFLPQAGRLLLYREPRLPGIRIDSGFTEGDEVPVYYDPLLAKVIATAETREQAVSRLSAALRAFPILGIRTNIPFLLRILDHPRFQSGNVDTGFLDAEIESLTAGANNDSPPPPHVAAAFEAHRASVAQNVPRPSWNPWDSLAAEGVGEAVASGAAARVGPGMYQTTTIEGRRAIVYVAGSGTAVSAFSDGRVFARAGGAAPPSGERGLRGRDPTAPAGGSAEAARVGQSGSQPVHAVRGAAHVVTAPMPGTVLQILVQVGDRVASGEPVVILEAMKMELPVRSLDDGTVVSVMCRAGELVQADAVLIELTP